jgi:F0F1-type ATP synthase assembly protein I
MPDDQMPTDDEINARFEKLKEKLHVDLEDVDGKLEHILSETEAPRVPDTVHDEMLSKLDAIEQRAASAKQTLDKTKPQANSLSGGMDQKSALGMGLGLTMAYTIVGTPLAGYGIGLLINKSTGGNSWHIWLTLLGSVIGIGWVAMVANRHANRL